MKLIIEADLKNRPTLPQVMIIINEAMQAWYQGTSKSDLAEMVEQKHNWIDKYNVGLLAEGTNVDDEETFLRVAVTDSTFDTSQWGKEMLEANPGRCTPRQVGTNNGF